MILNILNKIFKTGKFLLFGLLLFNGCQQPKETPTKGSLNAEVDEAVFPIISKESVVFDSLYKSAQIELKKVTPTEGFTALLNNKTKMFVCTRNFNKQEQDFVTKEKLNIQTFKFCYSSVVLVASKNNSIAHIRVDEIKDALLGNSSKISLMLPPKNSTVYDYVKENILNGADPSGAEIVPEENEIISKAEKSNKIGIVSFNLVQDTSKIKFVNVGEMNHHNLDINYFEPHPGFVLKGYYPLTDTVYIFLNELGMSVASGFTTFLTSYQGQKIALGQNLAPAAVPVKINEPQ
jgi:ABC-type phosphate transport system substrate-binding protein